MLPLTAPNGAGRKSKPVSKTQRGTPQHDTPPKWVPQAQSVGLRGCLVPLFAVTPRHSSRCSPLQPQAGISQNISSQELAIHSEPNTHGDFE
ncbi:hypothetical protein NDU88_004254 [Pleurodeles waltl]|uniref:Uncharacterized protein n=1 Tax=Pleurodeles waltl TaxID=8319 RepID=A0AAV7M5U8_PLEWA|nr:hypothetical protein NDU88_004254 [Pleurodeles waltl]